MSKIIYILFFIFIISFPSYSKVVKVYHTVKKGETLTSIANKYGTSVEKIKKLNGLNTSLIKSGQKLIVKEIKEKDDENLLSSNCEYDTVYYKVKKGDSLWRISEKFNIPISEIKKSNNLKSDKITPGMSLKINLPKKASAKVPEVNNVVPIV